MASGYDAVKKRSAEASRDRSKSGREVGPLPAVADPVRKESCRTDFALFRRTYFAQRFPLSDSADHVKANDCIQTCVRDGGQFAFAMPRGSGKTTLAIVAAVWAIAFGHRRFVVLLAATGVKAKDLLLEIKTECETNELLAADFPELVHCIVKLEGINNRTAGQTLDGKRTRITWTDKKIVFPTIEGSASSGAVIVALGLTGAIRGLRHTGADGVTFRPDLVIPDDPQTRASAYSVGQTATRTKLIAGDVLGLAGPGQRIAAVMPCTVIAPGDAAEQLLDRKKHPEWNGHRCKLVYAFPTNEKMWEEYGRIRAESLELGNDGREATEFYRAHQKEMDEGCVIAWEHRFNRDEISAVQNAMNLRLADLAVFMAEYQNEPIAVGNQAAAADAISPELVVHRDRLTQLGRWAVPRESIHLTGFVDVQAEILYGVAIAWDAHFGGSVVDYLTYPEQNRDYFVASDPQPKLTDVHPGLVFEARLMTGLMKIIDLMVTRKYPRDDSAEQFATMAKILIDANWGKSTDTVYKFCRSSAHSSILLPSHGKGIGASSRPMSEWQRMPGDQAGPGWRLQHGTGGNRGRHVLIDTNSVKTFIADRFKAPVGTPGCLRVFGKTARQHRLFADHIASEYPIRTMGRGRELDEWRLRPGQSENHWLDGVVGCAVAASILGLRFDSAAAVGLAGKPKKPKMSLRERQELARSKH